MNSNIDHKIKVIGFSGKLGTGKNYLAEQLLPRLVDFNRYRVKYVSLADTLKVLTAVRNNIPIQRMYGNKTKEDRILLQQEGTERGRKVYGEDYWLDIVKAWIEVDSAPPNRFDLYILTDVRFPNEAAWVQQNGVLIRLYAPDRNHVRVHHESGGNEEVMKQITTHASETALDEFKFDHVVNNTIDQPHVQDALKHILTTHHLELRENRLGENRLQRALAVTILVTLIRLGLLIFVLNIKR